MKTSTVFITAGLNVGTTPMSGKDIGALDRAIRAAIADTGGTLFFYGDGNGVWEGQEEASLVFGATFPHVSNLNSDGIRYELRRIAYRFGQEAIGLTIHDHANFGESFVTA